MCNCTLCQRRTGAPVHIGAWWPMEDVSIAGETKAFTRTTGERGLEARFNFCPECGTSVWWGGRTDGGPLSGYYGIAGGCFADPDFPAPTHSVFERTRHPWIHAPEGTICFEASFDPAVMADIMDRMRKRLER
jgi:hypothetical protein